MKKLACSLVVTASILAGGAVAASAQNSDTLKRTTSPAALPAHVPVAKRQHGYTGFSIGGTVTGKAGHPDTFHAVIAVTAVAPRSPASKAGLLVGDIILEINGTPSDQEWPFPEIGVKYTLRIRRGAEEREVTLLPTAAPSRAQPNDQK